MERRKHRRVKTNWNVKMRILYSPNNNTKKIKGKIRNISKGGFFVETKDRIGVEKGALASFEFKPPHKTKTAEALGLIRWTNPDRGLGVEFFFGSEQERKKIYADLPQGE